MSNRDKYPSELAERFQLRLPPGLRDRIKSYAERHGRSMNTEIVRILEREFPEQKTLYERVENLLKLTSALKGASADEIVEKLGMEISDTVAAIADGRVRGVNEEDRAFVAARLEDWLLELEEDRQSEYFQSLDQDEIDSIDRFGNTSKIEK